MSKPLGHKAYGSIPHLPGSRLGPGDHHIHEGQAAILTQRTRDRHDEILVQEKLDGSCVAIANVDGRLVAITRAGHTATSSPYEQHHLFAHWVRENEHRFHFLQPGQRIVGEWLAQAHSIRYQVNDDTVFVAFDLMEGSNRAPHDQLAAAAGETLTLAPLLHRGPALPIEAALELLGEHGHHRALDPAEGVMYRCERNGAVEFLAKYVRHDFQPGRFLPEKSGLEPTWNWRPSKAPALTP
mgnify:CR=1 FL=1